MGLRRGRRARRLRRAAQVTRLLGFWPVRPQQHDPAYGKTPPDYDRLRRECWIPVALPPPALLSLAILRVPPLSKIPKNGGFHGSGLCTRTAFAWLGNSTAAVDLPGAQGEAELGVLSAVCCRVATSCSARRVCSGRRLPRASTVPPSVRVFRRKAPTARAPEGGP